MSSSEKLSVPDGYELTQLGPETREIPLHWDVRKLGTIANINMGSSPKSKYYNEQGEGLPFFQGNADFGPQHPQVTVWCTNPNKTADEEDLLLSVRAPVGDLNVADQHCCIGRGLAAISGEVADNGFLYYLLSFERPRLETYAQGSTFKSVNSGVLNNFPVQFPPLPEQRRIADILSTVDEQIQQTDELVTEYKHLRRGIVQDLYDETYGGTKPNPPERYIDPILEKRKEVWLEAEKEKKKRSGSEIDVDQSKYEPPLDLLFSSRLPTLPEGWRWVSLDTVVAYDIDYRGKTPPYSDLGVPVISSGNIQEGEITFSEERFVSPKTYDEWLTRGIPREGDLIVTTEAPVGKVAIYPNGKYLPTRRIIVFRTVGVDNRYLQAALNHPKVQSYLLAQSGGSTVGRILKDNLLRTPIPLPPKKEEERLATALNSLDQKIVDEQETKHRLQELKRGLMQDLLTGKVRVNTD